MTISINLIEQYAKTRKTKVIAHRFAEDNKSITFVLESGHKLTMTEDELKAAIAEAEKATQIEQAVEKARNTAGETEAEKKARLKAEAKAAKEAEKEKK